MDIMSPSKIRRVNVTEQELETYYKVKELLSFVEDGPDDNLPTPDDATVDRIIEERERADFLIAISKVIECPELFVSVLKLGVEQAWHIQDKTVPTEVHYSHKAVEAAIERRKHQSQCEEPVDEATRASMQHYEHMMLDCGIPF